MNGGNQAKKYGEWVQSGGCDKICWTITKQRVEITEIGLYEEW